MPFAIFIFSVPTCFAQSALGIRGDGSHGDTDIAKYLTEDGERLNDYSISLLTQHFGNKENWKPFSVYLEEIARNSQVQVIALGTSHTPYGTPAAIAEALGVLHHHGYATLFVEVRRDDWPFFEAYLDNYLTYQEMKAKVGDMYADLDENVLTIAKRLGFKLIAMDVRDEEPERNRFMAATILEYAKNNSTHKIIAIAGGHHMAQSWYYDVKHIIPLAAILREHYGDGLVTVEIAPASEAHPAITRPWDGRVPLGMMISTYSSPVEKVPYWITGADFRLVYPGWEHTMRYGDWDYLAFVPDALLALSVDTK